MSMVGRLSSVHEAPGSVLSINKKQYSKSHDTENKRVHCINYMSGKLPSSLQEETALVVMAYAGAWLQVTEQAAEA